MEIGLDSDGVLYNFTKAFHRYLNEQLGYAVNLDEEAPTWDWFVNFGITRDDFLEIMHAAVDAGSLFWEGDLYEPTIPADIKALRAAGHRVHIVTHRFSGRLRCSQEATRFWYNYVGIEYDSLTFSGDKTVVKTDVFLEDNIKNYDVLQAAGVKAYLVNRRYNILPDDRLRVDSFREFTNLLLERTDDVDILDSVRSGPDGSLLCRS